MPTVNANKDSFEPMSEDEGTSQSLMVSATSPEDPPAQRALQVIKANSKRSHSSRRSSHSSSSRPPSGRSHRAPGSLHLHDQSSVSGQRSNSSTVHLQDQRSVTQNFDQRSIQSQCWRGSRTGSCQRDGHHEPGTCGGESGPG